MDAHPRLPIGDRLIDFAIVLLASALLVWVGVIFAAIGSRGDGSSRGANGASPVSQAPAEPVSSWGHQAGWRLAWHDEFNGAACPSRAKWHFEHGFVRNGELQWYQPENAYCRDGALVLEARREETRNPHYQPSSTHWQRNRPVAKYTSASIASKYHFTYGRAEALIRIDPRLGSWPAFWTLGDGYRHAIRVWPATGEVDIMEYYRDLVLGNVCVPKKSWCGWSSARQSLAGLGGQDWADRFHLWAMDWSPRRIDLFMDGRLVNHFPVARASLGGRPNPYVNQPASLLLTQALGGVHGGDPTHTEFPIRLEVKYVRVYQRPRKVGRMN